MQNVTNVSLCCWHVYSQVSVVRGKVRAGDGSMLIGVRVSVVTQPLYGFTLTRELGLYVVYFISMIRFTAVICSLVYSLSLFVFIFILKFSRCNLCCN